MIRGHEESAVELISSFAAVYDQIVLPNKDATNEFHYHFQLFVST